VGWTWNRGLLFQSEDYRQVIHRRVAHPFVDSRFGSDTVGAPPFARFEEWV
jgi:hypothetical protein